MDVGDHARAESYLGQIGYYRLSGYWYPARQTSVGADAAGDPIPVVGDQFRPGTTFQRAVDLYVFDKRLRLLMLDALERIEVSVRVQASLILSARDPFAHRDPNRLHGNFAKKVDPATNKTRHQAWLDQLDEITDRSKEEFVQRYRQKYSSPLPIWIAIELWDFGLLSHFVSGMTLADATALAARYGIPGGSLLMSWLRTLNHVRNTCAHHNRLWNRISTDLPKHPRQGAVPDLAHLFVDRLAQNRLYAAAAIAQYFMQTISPKSSWAARLRQHMATFPTGPGIVVGQAGFPNNWHQLPLWQ